MRGHYYDDFSARAIRPTDAPTLRLTLADDESAEDRNARENKEKQDSGQGPRVIPSPESPASPADIDAIVNAIALQTIRGELNWDEASFREAHPTLAGITREQLDAVIAKGLA